MLRFVPLMIVTIAISTAHKMDAQQVAVEDGGLHRHYADGVVLHYLMTGGNDGWKYTIQAADSVKRDIKGRYYEELSWSDLTSNAQQTLTSASLGLRQTMSLDDPGTYMKVPSLENVQPLLIGPITDTLTLYSDLVFAINANLNGIGETAYVSRTAPNS